MKVSLYILFSVALFILLFFVWNDFGMIDCALCIFFFGIGSIFCGVVNFIILMLGKEPNEITFKDNRDKENYDYLLYYELMGMSSFWLRFIPTQLSSKFLKMKVFNRYQEIIEYEKEEKAKNSG